jgi:hypothetical protein
MQVYSKTCCCPYISNTLRHLCKHKNFTGVHQIVDKLLSTLNLSLKILSFASTFTRRMLHSILTVTLNEVSLNFFFLFQKQERSSAATESPLPSAKRPEPPNTTGGVPYACSIMNVRSEEEKWLERVWTAFCSGLVVSSNLTANPTYQRDLV